MEAKRTILVDMPGTGSGEYLVPNHGYPETGFLPGEEMIREGLRRIKAASQETVSSRIGIGITTHNRYEVFIETYKAIKMWLPPGARLVVVDDGSKNPVAEATFRFDKAHGIACAKNKCFELLDDCEHIFLFDDDCRPIQPGWYKPYIQSGENHLMYIFKDFATGRRLHDTKEIYRDNKIVAYNHPRGPMLYFRKICLDTVGGMDSIFGKWGYEHPDLSNRIYNAGLTRFRFADVINSSELFYSADEHEAVISTCPPGTERMKAIAANKPIYEARWKDKRYVHYREKEDIVITTIFTTVADPQRGQKWSWDKAIVKDLADSCAKHNAKLVVLCDVLPTMPTEHSNMVYVYSPASINPYFQRWVSIHKYLLQNKDWIGKVFCVDASDVIMLRNPFYEMLPGTLYTGDEHEITGCEWLKNHHPNKIVQEYIKVNANKQLLNAGLCGGTVDIVLDFIRTLTDFYFTQLAEGDGRDSTDMGTFNLIASQFAPTHGMQVNTIFKANQVNSVSWFKHK